MENSENRARERLAHEFVGAWCSRVNVKTEWQNLLHRAGLTLTSKTCGHREIGDLNCPWYVRGFGGAAEPIADFETALAASDSRPIKVSETAQIDADKTRAHLIAEKMKLLAVSPPRPYALVIAHDTLTDKKLLLDGNHTAAAVYRAASFDAECLWVSGERLKELFPDFHIINRT